MSNETQNCFTEATAAHELAFTRVFDVAPEKLYRCWTEPALLVQCFTPPPWKTIRAELDVRVGGSSFVVMQGPDGIEMPSRGVYLDVIANQKLVFTDAYTSAWVPSGKPFFTAIVTFENVDGKTKYTARALHWSAEDSKAHEAMGFYAGWGTVAEQMAALAKTL